MGSPRPVAVVQGLRTPAGSALADALTQAGWRPRPARPDPSRSSTASAVRAAVLVAHDGAGRREGAAAAERFLAQVRQAGIPHLVVVSSAMVLGARPGRPGPVPEDAAPAPESEQGEAGVLAAIERSALNHPAGAPVVTVLRPAVLVGPGVDTASTRHFQAPRLLVARGETMRWQFCHVEDLAAAVVTVLTQRAAGVFAVGCDGALTQPQVERLSALRPVALPESVALRTARRLQRAGLLPDGDDLAYAIHPWIVDAAGLRALGWRPAYDNVTCLEVLLDGIRDRRDRIVGGVDRNQAALGAASAAVALIGTAALIRRQRLRRSIRP